MKKPWLCGIGIHRRVHDVELVYHDYMGVPGLLIGEINHVKRCVRCGDVKVKTKSVWDGRKFVDTK